MYYYENYFLRSNQQAVQILFTLSNPLDELKPILCKSSDGKYIIFKTLSYN
jgi:hypothetical protein